RLAASAEKHSEHPVATAIVAEAERRQLVLTEPSAFRAVTGKGVVAEVDGRTVVVGNGRLFDDEQLSHPECVAAGCTAHVDGVCRALFVGAPEPAGCIEVRDTLRPDAPRVVAELKAAGIVRVVM